MAIRVSLQGRCVVAWLVGLAVFTSCSSPAPTATAERAELPYRLSDEECDNLIDVSTERISLRKVEGPSKTQQALDAANPGSADLSQYVLVFDVEQTFTNLLDRPLIIEEASATLEDAASGSSYETAYDLAAPIELGPHEARALTFEVQVPADQLSPSYVLGLVEGSALGMTIAPDLLIQVPDSDNCGYPDGMRVQGKEGTVEVHRPVEPSPLLDLFSGVLKAFAHA